MEFQHVDVFADRPFTGNSLTVFLTEGTMAAGQMLSVTQEFRHFESIFLWPGAADGRWRARVSAPALARAAITAADFAGRLAAVDAQFAYLLDPDGLEGRHWSNDGRIEDVATGSAAGTVGAYLARAGRVALNQPFTLHQGRFTGRPSQIQVDPRGSAGDIARILVGGQVALVAAGALQLPPRHVSRPRLYSEPVSSS